MSTEGTDKYDQWHALHSVDEGASTPWHLMVRSQIRAAEDLAGKRVLEIGCGRGGFACWLGTQPQRPREIVAADFSPAAINKAREYATSRGITGVSWEVRDIENLGGPGDEFDTVFSFETIEHVPNPPRAVAELARVLKPRGRLYLTTPNYMSTIGIYRAYLSLTGRRFDEGGQPICQLTMMPKTRRWVQRAGLKIIKSTGVGHYVPVPGRPPIRITALDRLLPLTSWTALHTVVVALKP